MNFLTVREMGTPTKTDLTIWNPDKKCLLKMVKDTPTSGS